MLERREGIRNGWHDGLVAPLHGGHVRMTAPAEDVFKLQRPLADGALMIVAMGEKTDEGGLAA